MRAISRACGYSTADCCGLIEALLLAAQDMSLVIRIPQQIAVASLKLV